MLKNYKVGGTSLEVELSKILPENAIVTKIYPENKDHKPRNCEGFYNHMPYSLISKKIDLSNSKSYIFVRNPYNVVMSNFFHNYNMNGEWERQNKDVQNKNLNFYINNEMVKSCKYLFTNDFGEICVDKIFKYEDGIEKQINSILPIHNISKIKMNTFEKKYRPSHIKYLDFFSSDHLEKIYKEWKWEFINFNYDK